MLKSIKYLQKSNYYKLYGWVVLLDHVHLLLEIISKKNISQVMHDLKSYTANQISKNITKSRGAEASATREINNNIDPVAQASLPEQKIFKIWQTSFYDHIIRDERDFYTHLNYIHYNPIKLGYVKRMSEYKYSSYHHFLKKYDKEWLISIFRDCPVANINIKENIF